MLVKCSTELAIILFGVSDAKGVLFFPVGDAGFPGLVFRPLPLVPLNLQLIGEINRYLGTDLDGRAVEICQDYVDQVEIADGSMASLYLGSLHSQPQLIGKDWAILPDMLRAMPRNRNRLPYLRAWQVLTGSLTLNTKAVESDDLGKLLD